MPPVILRPLTPQDEAAFFKGMKAWEGEELSWYTFDWKPGMSFSELLDRLNKNSQGIEIPQGWVPATMLYGFVNEDIVGRFHIRHELNQKLKVRGGHVGYSIAPKFRGKGYALEMFQAAIPTFKKLGLKELLVTCRDDNVASYKVIEKMGGRLIDQMWDEADQAMIRKYLVRIT